jgi:hypothetical protein
MFYLPKKVAALLLKILLKKVASGIEKFVIYKNIYQTKTDYLGKLHFLYPFGDNFKEFFSTKGRCYFFWRITGQIRWKPFNILKDAF